MAGWYTLENMPAGHIQYKGYYDKEWREVSPSEAWGLMKEYMKETTYSEFDRMIRNGLRGEEMSLLKGGSKFKFVPN